MRRIATAAVAAFCVVGGFVLGEFVRETRPVDNLVRPLLAAAVIAVVLGALATLFRGWAVAAAVFGAAWVVMPGTPVAVGVAIVVAALLAYRLVKRTTPQMDAPLVIGAVIFFVAGIVPVVPMLSWSSPARADTSYEGPAQFAVLLDAYPRPDTLAEYGLDITPFLEDLEERGFRVYENATSAHDNTFGTMTELLGGAGIPETVPEQRAIQKTWRFPPGWHYIAPRSNLATIPNVAALNQRAFTPFGAKLLLDSLPGPFFRGSVMDAFRSQLHDALGILASTDKRRVFAHFSAPHGPHLYRVDGTPTDPLNCYPACPPQGFEPARGYIQWLNGELIPVVDAILARHPDAEIVLFSDHGGRYDRDDLDEWTRVFFAARTPRRPDLFGESPHPRDVLQRLSGGQLLTP